MAIYIRNVHNPYTDGTVYDELCKTKALGMLWTNYYASKIAYVTPEVDAAIIMYFQSGFSTLSLSEYLDKVFSVGKVPLNDCD